MYIFRSSTIQIPSWRREEVKKNNAYLDFKVTSVGKVQ